MGIQDTLWTDDAIVEHLNARSSTITMPNGEHLIGLRSAFHLICMIRDDYEAAAQPPAWENAPEWAEWWAMDESGEAYWYDEKPKMYSVDWGISACGKSQLDKSYAVTWQETLRRRPQRGSDE